MKSIAETLPGLATVTEPFEICSRCLMDTTIHEIRFDAKGECQYCKIHDIMAAKYPLESPAREENLARLVADIKKKAHGKRYDVIIGVSGGRDSSWCLYNAVRVGLKPLAVHFDNGWNSTVSVTNIHNVTRKLGIDLETVVADWDEFRDLQLSFLEASVPDVEVPTDLAIHGVLHRIAAREGLSYIFFGHSFRTEGVSPMSWSFIDGKYIASVQKRFGTRPLKDFHNFRIADLINYTLIRRMKVVPFLNYFPYDQKEVDRLLREELDWTYYGGHHHESTYTRFIQSYLLPQKFNIDKRKTEYSALVRSNQKDRAEALHEIRTHQYEYDPKLLPYVIAKLEITQERWDRIFNAPVKSFRDYPSYYPLLRLLKAPIKVATELGIFPELLYLKYLG